ncbi:hypothetical protein SH467x_000668 [Pirellulaceae bacterium SH467]|jgi:hypothetical protein
MSNGDSLRERGSALENQFFSSLDAKLLEELKADVEAELAINHLGRISGIQDQNVLGALTKLGVSPATFAALRVFPLVAVAWADGRLEKAERELIEENVSKHAIEEGSAAMQLLDQWLAKKPGSELLGVWESYAKSLVASLDQEEADLLKATLVEEIQQVASASGGLLGWASISKGEHEVMNRIVAALTK